MLFPVRDSIPSQRYPAVNTLMIVVCGAVFVYQLLLGPELPRLFALAAFIPARLFDSVQFFQGTLSLATTPAGAGGVAWFAHIGGFVFGFALAWWMKATGRVKPVPARYVVWYRY